MSARIVVPVAVVLCLATLGSPAAAQLDFGPVVLGQIKTGCVEVCFGSACGAGGTISQAGFSDSAPFFVRGLRRGPSDEDLCQKPQKAQGVELPVNLQPGQSLMFDIDLVADPIGFHDQDLRVNGQPVLSVLANVGQAPPCQPTFPDNLCLQNDRFAVRTFWRTQFGTRGPGTVVPGVASDDSGLFYFFNSDNWEVLLKVLDACKHPSERFWVFSAATTNVEYTITVTDTDAQQVNTYVNPLGLSAPAVTDTAAFATCP